MPSSIVECVRYLLARLAAVIALLLCVLVLSLHAGQPLAGTIRSVAGHFTPRTIGAAWIAVTLVAALTGVIRARATAQPIARPGAARLPLAVVGVGLLLIGAVTLPTPWRLATNLLCFTLLSVPIVWLVARVAGRRSALDTALALSAFALVPAPLDTPRPPGTVNFETASPYRWSVGFPTTAWRLGHEVRLAQPLDQTPVDLLVWLAREQTGRAQLVAWLNGHPLGPLHEEPFNTRAVAVPPALSAGQVVLRFELGVTELDPSLRIPAHPWPGGATAGRDASRYFDGQRWWPGTFSDSARQPQAGLYVISVRGIWR